MPSINEWAIEQIAGRTVKAVGTGQVSGAIKRVDTLKGIQRHRGYRGYVYVTFEGERHPETFRTGFHQKAKAARAHAEQIARAFQRQMAKQPSTKTMPQSIKSAPWGYKR
jgi:hypothetical protein